MIYLNSHLSFLASIKWCTTTWSWFNAINWWFTTWSWSAQIDDSGHRILQENTENCWNMEAVIRAEIVRTFRWSDNFLYLSAGTDRKSPEKIRKISGPNIASTKSMELRGTGGFRAGLPDLGNANNWWSTTWAWFNANNWWSLIYSLFTAIKS